MRINFINKFRIRIHCLLHKHIYDINYKYMYVECNTCNYGREIVDRLN
jgi:hypothetical protein